MNVALKPRWTHSLTAFSLGPGLTEVTVFGGTAEPLTGSVETQPKLANTTLLQFSELLNVHVHTVYTMYHYMYMYIHMYNVVLLI